jgi:hypothetical protein
MVGALCLVFLVSGAAALVFETLWFREAGLALGNALSAYDSNFGRVLGRLHGWNTLGAVLGTLAGDLVLIEAVRIRGAALAAAGLNVVAAIAAVALARRFSGAPRPEQRPAAGWRGGPPLRLLAAALLSGGTLLGLEVVWFRFLLSFTAASAWTFAVMLLGIAAGGLLAAALLESALVRRLWPATWREKTREAFPAQDALNASILGSREPAGTLLLALDRLLGLDALARRDYGGAERRLGLAEPHAAHAARIRMSRVLALGLAGDGEGCLRLLESARGLAGAPADPAPWRWLAARFSLADPTT